MATSRRESLKKGMTLPQQYLIGCFVLLTVIAFSGLYIMELALKPFETAQNEAVQLAKKYADVTQTDEVAIFNGAESFYSVLGSQSTGEKVAVLIPQEGGDIHIYPLAEGISREKAEQTARENGASQIDRLTFGYADNQPIWEVKSGTAYYVISFETGEFLKKEGL